MAAATWYQWQERDAPGAACGGMPQLRFCSRGVVGLEHPVADGAGDGDVEPERKDPAGELAVDGEMIGPAGDEGEENKGQTNCGEDDVGDEQDEIDGPHGTLAAVAGGIIGHMVGHIG